MEHVNEMSITNTFRYCSILPEGCIITGISGAVYLWVTVSGKASVDDTKAVSADSVTPGVVPHTPDI
jgi:hypothetical protein